MSPSTDLTQAKRWVIKIGSALLTDEGRGLNHAGIKNWADQIAQLKKQGKEVVLVSSGSVAEGMSRMGWTTRPKAIHQLQAAAAVGQMGLVQAYEQSFKQHSLHSAQILLTHQDLSDRRRYLNARSTLTTLIDMGVIPVVNENDTTATDEIRFGDNDTLAALVANLIDADVLVILTDQKGLYNKDPRSNPDAELISQAAAHDNSLESFAGGAASQLSRGGMRTKVLAAQRAARSGTHTAIASGHEEKQILRLAKGEPVGTLLTASKQASRARKQWIANTLKSKGTLHLDDGAAHALKAGGRSLLAVGVKSIDGAFRRGDMVTCVASDGETVAHGLINYNSDDTRKISGKPSESILETIGYCNEPELIHRDNLVLI